MPSLRYFSILFPTVLVTLGVAFGQVANESAAPKDVQKNEASLEWILKSIEEIRGKLIVSAKQGESNANNSIALRGLSEAKGMLDSLLSEIQRENYARGVQNIKSFLERSRLEDHRKEIEDLLKQFDAFAEQERQRFMMRMSQLAKEIEVAVAKEPTIEQLQSLISICRTLKQRIESGLFDALTRPAIETQFQRLLVLEASLGKLVEFLEAEKADNSRAIIELASRYSRPDHREIDPSVRNLFLAKLKTLRQKWDSDFQAKWTELSELLKKDFQEESLKSAFQKLYGMVRTNPFEHAGGWDPSTYLGDLNMAESWYRVLEQQSQGKYRSAIKLANDLKSQRQSLQRQSQPLLAEQTMAKKMDELQSQVLSQAERVKDPTYIALIESLNKAESVEQLDEAAKNVERVLALKAGLTTSIDFDAQPIETELRTAALFVASIVEMKSAVRNREWGRFWQLHQSVVNFHNGQATNDSGKSRWNEKLHTIRRSLIRQAAIASIDPKDLNMELKPNESLDVDLLRVVDEALKKSEYRRASRLLQAYATMTYSVLPGMVKHDIQSIPVSLRADIRGLDTFAQAVDFEAAGDTAAALMRFREVIQLNGTRVPFKQATEHIAAINKAHPELLKQIQAPQNIPFQ